MPHVLQKLMRHEAIETTMKYYVGQDAQSTAAELYQAIGQAAEAAIPRNTLSNTGPSNGRVG